MNKKILTLTACVAWAGVAISNAAPANALAATLQVGNYASCSAAYNIRFFREICGRVA